MSVGRIAVLLIVLGIAAGAGILAWGAPGERVAVPLEREAITAPGERVRVEVLNAGGVSGFARTATVELRGAGFDVVHFGNARAFDRESSAVIDRVGRPDFARAVANALGIDTVLTQPDPNLFVDVTVLLGRSWSGREGASASREPPSRALWDPRGWLGR